MPSEGVKRTIFILSAEVDKGFAAFARSLWILGFEVLAKGGIAEALIAASVPVRDAVGILGGKMAVLSSCIHAGLLALDTPEMRAQLERHSIPFLDLLYAEFSPSLEELSNPRFPHELAIEKIGLSAPTLARVAAAGSKIVIVDPGDKDFVLQWIQGGMPREEVMRQALGAKAEYATSQYSYWAAWRRSYGAVLGPGMPRRMAPLSLFFNSINRAGK